MLRRQFQLDTDGDLDLSTGNLVLLAADAALAQRIEDRLRTFLGEVFTNKSLGVPYFQQVFKNKNPKVSVLNSAFVGAALSVDGVETVDSAEYDLDANRALSVEMRVTGEDTTAIDLTFAAEV